MIRNAIYDAHCANRAMAPTPAELLLPMQAANDDLAEMVWSLKSVVSSTVGQSDWGSKNPDGYEQFIVQLGEAFRAIIQRSKRDKRSAVAARLVLAMPRHLVRRMPMNATMVANTVRYIKEWLNRDPVDETMALNERQVELMALMSPKAVRTLVASYANGPYARWAMADLILWMPRSMIGTMPITEDLAAQVAEDYLDEINRSKLGAEIQERIADVIALMAPAAAQKLMAGNVGAPWAMAALARLGKAA